MRFTLFGCYHFLLDAIRFTNCLALWKGNIHAERRSLLWFSGNSCPDHNGTEAFVSETGRRPHWGPPVSAARNIPIAVFRVGRLVITPNARDSLPPQEVTQVIQRHQAGDWGDVTADDWDKNDRALLDGSRILSVYHSSAGTKFWLLTEADRSMTTVLLPSDY